MCFGVSAHQVAGTRSLRADRRWLRVPVLRPTSVVKMPLVSFSLHKVTAVGEPCRCRGGFDGCGRIQPPTHRGDGADHEPSKDPSCTSRKRVWLGGVLIARPTDQHDEQETEQSE